jgi:putative tricarboxylic transport membrane protein
MLNKIKLNTVVCAVFLGFALFYFYVAMGLNYWSGAYAPGPGFIPRWVSGAMVVLSAFALINSFKEKGPVLSEILPKERSGRINLFVCWGALLFLLLFVEKLGFAVTASIALTAMLSRGTNWLKAALIGVSLSLICFFIFKVLLQMPIPVNQFGW